MPAGGQDGLHILRPLIDGLIPRQSCLLTEGGHGLNELIDLRIRQMLPIAGLDVFDLISVRTRVPILNRNGIGRAVNG